MLLQVADGFLQGIACQSIADVEGLHLGYQGLLQFLNGLVSGHQSGAGMLVQFALGFEQRVIGLPLADQCLVDSAQGLNQCVLGLLALLLLGLAAEFEGGFHLTDTPAQAPLFVAIAGRPGLEQQEGHDAPGRGFELSAQAFHHAHQVGHGTVHAATGVGFEQNRRGLVQGDTQAEKCAEQT